MLAKATFAFLVELKKHNDRDWFQANKDRYLEAKADFEKLVGELIGAISAFDKSIEHVDPAKCTFRIFRDTRFAKDKSPYKTNMGAHIGVAENKFQQKAGYYFHFEPGNCFLGGGAYRPEAKWLKAIRDAISEDGKFFRGVINAAAFKKQYGSMSGETLKKAPQGYPPDHPHIDLLKHKDFLGMKTLKDSDVLKPAFVKEAAAAFKALLPFNRFLNDVLES